MQPNVPDPNAPEGNADDALTMPVRPVADSLPWQRHLIAGFKRDQQYLESQFADRLASSFNLLGALGGQGPRGRHGG